MYNNSNNNIHKNYSVNSTPGSKRWSSKLIERIKLRQSLQKAKIQKISKNASLLLKQVRRNSDIELKKLKLSLSENEDLSNSEKAKNLFILIAQLNGVNPIQNFYLDNNNDNTALLLTKKILKIFEDYNFFYFFFSHYNITNEILLKIIPTINYQFFKKNEVIYKEGDKCTKFYFLIKGKIAFNKKLMDGTEVEQFSIEEEGYNFGDWEIINNRFNKYTLICKENCYLIYIPKDIFIKYIQDKYIKVENDIKHYLMKNLRNYIIIPQIKLERFIDTNVKSLFFRKNDIVFRKGEETKYIYFIYKGEINIVKDIDKGEDSSFITSKNNVSIEFIQKKAKNINYNNIIKKFILKDEESKNNLKLEMALDKNKYNIMTTLTKGCLIGLEIVTGIYFFKYTYVCKSDFASVLEVNIENLDEHLKELMINLMPYYFRLEDKIHEQMDKITFLNYNFLPKSIQKYKTRNKFYKYTKFIDALKIEEDEKSFLKQIKKIDNKFDTNEAGFIKITNHNKILQSQKKLLIDKLRDNYFKSQSLDLLLRDLNKNHIKNLKYKNVKMFDYNTNKVKNKSKTLFINNRKPFSVLLNKIKTKSVSISHKKNIKEKSGENIYDKLNSRTTSYSTTIPKKIKNYNLYDKEEKKDVQKQINILKNNKKQYNTFIKLQRKKNNIKDIKQGLALDCKALIKKVLIRNKLQKEKKINNCSKHKDEDEGININKNIEKINFKWNKSVNDILNEDKNKIFNGNKEKKIVNNIFMKKEKKLNFYDTGIFDMPLASQLGSNLKKISFHHFQK